MKTIIYICETKDGFRNIFAGSVDNLVKKFSMMISEAHSKNNKINNQPKNSKSLLNSLNKSAEICNIEAKYELTNKISFLIQEANK
jgi:hypothetical protein